MPRSAAKPGLVLLTLAAATAGFLATSVPSTTTAEATDPIEPGQARLVEPGPDRVTLTAPEDEGSQVLVYDPEDGFQRSLTLGPEERAELAPSEEVVLLVPRHGAPLELDTPDPDRVSPAPTRAALHGLVSASGPVDDQVTLTLHHAPHSLGLRVDGQAEDLDVLVETTEGTVLRQAHNPNQAAPPLLDASLLTNGTYRVSVTAESLEGELHLVPRYLAHDEPLDPLEAPDALDDRGTVVARIQAGDAWLLPSDAEELALALERGAWADVRLYSAEHRLLDRLEIGQEGPEWEWTNTSGEVDYRSMPLAREEVSAVYVEEVQADTDATVYVLSPDDELAPGRPAEVRTSSVTVPYPSPSGTEQAPARYLGGLVDVRIGEAQGAAAERRITVHGPDGLVLDRYDRATGDDASPMGDEVRHIESYGPGPLTVAVEAEAASGSVQIELDHYVPGP